MLLIGDEARLSWKVAGYINHHITAYEAGLYFDAPGLKVYALESMDQQIWCIDEPPSMRDLLDAYDFCTSVEPRLCEMEQCLLFHIGFRRGLVPLPLFSAP